MAYTPLVLLLVLIFGHIIYALPIGFCSPDNVASTGPTQSVYMSNGLCQTRCTGQYAYAVIIGQSCYCSDNVPATQVSTDDCHDPCPGYPPDFCGNATAGYYAYFNLGRAASATIQLSTAAVSLSSTEIVIGSTTSISTYIVPLTTPATSSTTSSSTASPTSTSTGPSTNIVAIQQYIQSALSTQSGPDATDACFLNVGNTLYTSPSWYQHAPTQVQSYFSSTHQNTSATCAALAGTLFASHAHHGLSKGAKAGIIVGSILGALLIAGIVSILLCLCLLRRRRRSSERNSIMDEKMDEKPQGVAAARMPTQLVDNEHNSEHDFDDHSIVHGAVIDHQQPLYYEKPKEVEAARMPTQFENEHNFEHDFDDHSIVHGGVIDHEQPLYYDEATVTPSTAAPALTYGRPSSPFFGSPTSRTAMAAAALAWGRDHPHDSSAQRVPAHGENSVSESQASSVYEAALEAPQPQQMSSPTHNGQQGPARTNTEQDFYILHQQNPYQFPTVPGSSAVARHEKNVPRQPVGILKNRLNNDRDGERMTALPSLGGQRSSDQYTFYDEHGDDDYPFHAR